MKHKFLWLALLAVCTICYADQTTLFVPISPAVTSLAATSTNTTDGTALQVPSGGAPVRLYLTASGIAATTNGTFTVYFRTASGNGYTTNSFDTSSSSYIRLQFTTLGGSTNTVSDWFQLTGVRYIKVGRMENTFQGAVSNISLNLSYQN